MNVVHKVALEGRQRRIVQPMCLDQKFSVILNQAKPLFIYFAPPKALLQKL